MQQKTPGNEADKISTVKKEKGCIANLLWRDQQQEVSDNWELNLIILIKGCKE